MFAVLFSFDCFVKAPFIYFEKRCFIRRFFVSFWAVFFCISVGNFFRSINLLLFYSLVTVVAFNFLCIETKNRRWSSSKSRENENTNFTVAFSFVSASQHRFIRFGKQRKPSLRSENSNGMEKMLTNCK